MQPLFLVGYMGCGKSTLGRKLASRLGLSFLDTDRMVEEKEGATVAEIFGYEGEEYFRLSERKILEKVISENRRGVFSTGGGLPTWEDNMEVMNQQGITIYLKRPAEQIIRRLSPYGRQKRPRLRGLSDEELLAFMTEDMVKREQFYAKAKITISCESLADKDLIEEILQRIEDLEKKENGRQ